MSGAHSRFGTTYVGTKFLGGNPGDPATVLMGDVDPSGNMTANIVHSPLDRLRCKMMAQARQILCLRNCVYEHISNLGSVFHYHLANIYLRN